MCVDVAPVDDFGVRQPRQPADSVDLEALAPDDDPVVRDIDAQVGDLVLDDDGDARVDRESGQALRRATPLR